MDEGFYSELAERAAADFDFYRVRDGGRVLGVAVCDDRDPDFVPDAVRAVLSGDMDGEPASRIVDCYDVRALCGVCTQLDPARLARDWASQVPGARVAGNSLFLQGERIAPDLSDARAVARALALSAPAAAWGAVSRQAPVAAVHVYDHGYRVDEPARWDASARREPGRFIHAAGSVCFMEPGAIRAAHRLGGRVIPRALRRCLEDALAVRVDAVRSYETCVQKAFTVFDPVDGRVVDEGPLPVYQGETLAGALGARLSDMGCAGSPRPTGLGGLLRRRALRPLSR